MSTITSIELATALGRSNHGNLLITLRRIEAKTGYSFTKAMRTVVMKHGFKRECPYYKLSLEDCRFIADHLMKPGESEKMRDFITQHTTKEHTKSGAQPLKYTDEAVSNQPHIEMFVSDTFGELHTVYTDGKLWYCVSDICRSLELLLKEGERVVNQYGNSTIDLLVKRHKRTANEIFTDYDGFITIIIESRKAKANLYRKWAESILPTKNPTPAIAPENYPSLDEYFTQYVPASEFHHALTEVNNHCTSAAGRALMKPEKRKSLLHDVGILSTFCDTLQAVYQLA